ncbi:peptidoglycan synthase, partial [Klebsiella pneumoniae]
WIDPQTTMEKGGVGYGPRWQAMAEALHLNLGELAQRVQSHPHARFLYLARQINPEQAEWIDKLHLPGVYLRDESRRFYPAGHVAANLLGFTNVDNQGIEGVEKSFNAQLTGKPGRRLVRKDKHGNVIENITEV